MLYEIGLKGNDYRLVAEIKYEYRVVYVCFVKSGTNGRTIGYCRNSSGPVRCGGNLVWRHEIPTFAKCCAKSAILIHRGDSHGSKLLAVLHDRCPARSF